MLNKLKELRKGAGEDGFTLIELMVVVLIIGILAAIAIPIFLNQQAEARNGGVRSDVRNTVTNVATFLVSNPSAVGYSVEQTGPAGTPVAAGFGTATPFEVVVSDAATTVSVEADAAVIGSYTVTGENGDFTYSFDSTTGEYTNA